MQSLGDIRPKSTVLTRIQTQGTSNRSRSAIGAAGITTPMIDKALKINKNGQEGTPSSNSGATQAAATTERRRLEMVVLRTPGTKARSSGILHRPGLQPTHTYHTSHKPYLHHMYAKIYMGLHFIASDVYFPVLIVVEVCSYLY